MKTFNAFQMVIFFLLTPFAIGWMRTRPNPFPYSPVAGFILLIAEAVLFGYIVYAVRRAID